MKSTDAVVAAIDAALDDFGVSDDAMRCSYDDELPPVEDRGGPYDSGFEVSYGGHDVQFWIYAEAIGQPATSRLDDLPSGWQDVGYLTDTPESFGGADERTWGYDHVRSSVYRHAVFTSMLLYGDVFIDRGADGSPRVVRPIETTRNGRTVYEPLRLRLERELGVPVTDGQAEFVAAWNSSGDPAADRARMLEDLRASSTVVALKYGGYGVPLAQVDEHLLGVSVSSQGGYVALVTKTEMRPRLPQPVEPEGPVGLMTRALDARRTRSTGPAQNPHRHRGLRR